MQIKNIFIFFHYYFLIYNYMWKYTNVTFIYSNSVASKFGEFGTAPILYTYMKSKFALMEALRIFAHENFECGVYTSIDPKSVKHDKPIKV